MSAKNRLGHSAPVSGALCQQEPSGAQAQEYPKMVTTPLSNASNCPSSAGRCQGREGSSGEGLVQNEYRGTSCTENCRCSDCLPSPCRRWSSENSARSRAWLHHSRRPGAASAFTDEARRWGRASGLNESVTRNDQPYRMSGKENCEQGSVHSALARCTVDEGTVHSSCAEVNAEIPRKDRPSVLTQFSAAIRGECVTIRQRLYGSGASGERH